MDIIPVIYKNVKNIERITPRTLDPEGELNLSERIISEINDLFRDTVLAT